MSAECGNKPIIAADKTPSFSLKSFITTMSNKTVLEMKWKLISNIPYLKKDNILRLKDRNWTNFHIPVRQKTLLDDNREM